MHELAVTERVIATVQEHVGEARVRRVVLEIGRLSGVVPDSVRFCFDVCAAGTSIEGAALEIHEVPGLAWCPACREHFAIEYPLGLCDCGSPEVEIVGGRELRVSEVEIV